MSFRSCRRSKSATELRTTRRNNVHNHRRRTIFTRSPLHFTNDCSHECCDNTEKQSEIRTEHFGAVNPPEKDFRIALDNNKEKSYDPRQWNSLPPYYRLRKRQYSPVQRQASLACSDQSSDKLILAKPSIDPVEFKRRLEVMKTWFRDFTQDQKTLFVKGIFSELGDVQLHWMSTQVPGQNPGLHDSCPPGCSDPFYILPLHLTYKILGLLDPVSLATAGRVCSTWHYHSMAPSHWQTLCHQRPWHLSPQGSQAQLERWLPAVPDWRRVFVERYKLRRAWLAGQCHVRTFEGHSGGISCVQFDGTRIVSGSHDKTIKVWNVKTNSPWSVMTLAGHSGEVRCLHLEGNRLVSGSTDLSIKVWDLDIQQCWSSIACRVTMVGHSDTVRCVLMNRKKDRVISGSYDTTLKVWGLKTGVCQATFWGHSGPVLAIHAQGNRLISGSGDKSIRAWHLDTGYCAAVLRGHKDAVTCLTMDSSDQRIISGSLDRTIKLWSISRLECVATLDWISSEGHTGVIRCLQADQWRILSAADDKTIKVWDIETGQRLVTLKSHSDGVTCLQFNDFYIVSGSYDKTVKLWDFTVC